MLLLKMARLLFMAYILVLMNLVIYIIRIRLELENFCFINMRLISFLVRFNNKVFLLFLFLLISKVLRLRFKLELVRVKSYLTNVRI